MNVPCSCRDVSVSGFVFAHGDGLTFFRLPAYAKVVDDNVEGCACHGCQLAGLRAENAAAEARSR